MDCDIVNWRLGIGRLERHRVWDRLLLEWESCQSICSSSLLLCWQSHCGSNNCKMSFLSIPRIVQFHFHDAGISNQCPHNGCQWYPPRRLLPWRNIPNAIQDGHIPGMCPTNNRFGRPHPCRPSTNKSLESVFSQTYRCCCRWYGLVIPFHRQTTAPIVSHSWVDSVYQSTNSHQTFGMPNSYPEVLPPVPPCLECVEWLGDSVELGWYGGLLNHLERQFHTCSLILQRTCLVLDIWQ